MEIRSKLPSKSFTGIVYKTYQTNKKYLAQDFDNRCAYCNDPDKYSGGQRSFHIDHFAPRSLFPSLEFDYNNLMYSCPYCNSAKSNKWPSDSEKVSVVGNVGFLSPCENEYYKHIKRSKNGNLFYTDLLGKYIYENLALGLQRHKYIYFADNISQRIDKLEEIMQNQNLNEARKRVLKDLYFELLYEFYHYWKKIY